MVWKQRGDGSWIEEGTGKVSATSPYAAAYASQGQPTAASPYAAYKNAPGAPAPAPTPAPSPYAAYKNAPGAPAPAPPPRPVGAQSNGGFAGGPTGAQVAAGYTPPERAAQQATALRRYTDKNSPDYKGPAYSITTDAQGNAVLRKSTDPTVLGEQAAFENGRGKYASNEPHVNAGVPPNVQALLGQGTGAGGSNVATDAAGQNALYAAIAKARALHPELTSGQHGITNAPPDAGAWGNVDEAGRERAENLLQAASDASNSVQGPGAEAADINRKKIDEILGGLSSYENKMADMAGDNTGLSVAEAQLQKATNLANLQAGIDTEASQRAALGQARSARSRGDRALLERGAIGEAAYVGQEAARTASLRRAQNEGDLAELRAAEADADRRFRLDALGKAADLGLNRTALEVDLSKANLQSANEWVNNQFQQLGLDKQLNQSQAQMLLNYTRDMAAIEFQYDQLSSAEQQEAEKLIMQKYGIDEQTRLGMKQIKEAGKFKWDQVLAGMAGGAGQAATTALFASDERVKKDFAPVLADELDELMSALSAQTWKYKEPEKHGAGLRFGPMAQELERTRLGKSMVKPDASGTKFVDTGQLTLATASGLAHLHQRLAALEGAAPSQSEN